MNRGGAGRRGGIGGFGLGHFQGGGREGGWLQLLLLFLLFPSPLPPLPPLIQGLRSLTNLCDCRPSPPSTQSFSPFPLPPPPPSKESSQRAPCRSLAPAVMQNPRFFCDEREGLPQLFIIIILSKKHHGIRGALEGGGGFGWWVEEREEKPEILSLSKGALALLYTILEKKSLASPPLHLLLPPIKRNLLLVLMPSTSPLTSVLVMFAPFQCLETLKSSLRAFKTTPPQRALSFSLFICA